MTTGNAGERMTRAELTAFALKVEDWGRSLTPREQEFLTELIARAASVEQTDVQGYGNPSSSKSQRPVESLAQGSHITFEFLITSFLKLNA